ncbi:hypothetical protein [Enterobacter bugandensis]
MMTGRRLYRCRPEIGGQADRLNALLKSCAWEAVSNDDHWKLVAIKAS